MKSKLYFGLILLQLFLENVKATAQSSDTAVWAWVKTLSSTNNIYGNAIAIDPKGNGDIYVAGGFEGTVDFDPGTGTFWLASGSPQVVGIFVSKFNGSGDFVWARAMTRVGVGAAFAGAMAIDPDDGAIYTTGLMEGSIDFDPGPNNFKLTSAGNYDIFISKLDSEGNFVWAKVLGGTEDDYGSALVIDPGGSGDVYLNGQFKDTVDFDPGTEVFNLASRGNYDVFISKLNRSGNFLWAKAIGGTGSDLSRSIAFDPTGGGKVYTTGIFEKTVDFDPGADTYNLLASEGQENFISKIDTSGNFLWAKQLGRVGSELDNSIALDPADSKGIYTTGSFRDTCDFNPGEGTYNLTSVLGSSDIFISKLDSSGHFVWAKAMGGTNQDYGTAVSILSGENAGIYYIGNFRGRVDFYSGPDTTSLTSAGLKDIFISKLDTSGNFQWVKAIKGTGNEYCRSIAMNNNCLYLTGFSPSPTLSFDNIIIQNGNLSGDDLFMGKLDFTTATTDIDSTMQQINLYPNPATNELTIEIEGEEFFNVNITMFNVLGEVVYFIPNQHIVQKQSIDISTLTSGIYFIELNIDGSRVVEKVVKE